MGVTASLAGQGALLGLPAPGPRFTRPLQVYCGLNGQDRMALWNFSPRCLTPRTPPLCWGGASTAPPPGRSGCSGIFALGSSPLDPTHLDGTQSKVALVSMPMTLKPVPGQGMSLRPPPCLPRGSHGKGQLEPLSLASCPPPCPNFSFKGIHPGFPHHTGHVGVPFA
ncbi:unnamed protein product [Rangifer tarandus platyrhynchus]|uniref:Uncharacterized protein n=1 Tax=Rangifer tarandus platyrhynchus TaxID=3082113 RepID=A0ABN8Y9N2_RANTA|nr:unnamed protein product [Rangifer tarandus platyrhynchus]